MANEDYILKEGTLLNGGKYRIVKHLSSGGFGKTYLAINTALDKPVAIKEHFIKGVCGRVDVTGEVTITLPENRPSFDTLKQKFRKEAQRLFDINNQHVVRVLDLFDELSTSYYVMEHIDGESLSAWLKRTEKPLTEDEVRALLPQLLDGLNAIHAKHIWHLDIKPGNIMLDKDSRAVFIDFGASKQLTTAEGETLSTSSSMAFTPGYAPSEQHDRNLDKFGPWTDLYALGATLYHLLTLLPPPMASDINDDPEGAFRLPATVSSEMRQLIMWMMQPSRLKRPQSVEDVRQRLVTSTPSMSTDTPAGSASSAATATPTPAENTVSAANEESTVVVNKTVDVKKDERKQTLPAKKSNKGIIILCVLICLAGIGAAIFFLNGKKKTSDDESEMTAQEIVNSDDLSVEEKTVQIYSLLVDAFETRDGEAARSIENIVVDWKKSLSPDEYLNVSDYLIREGWSDKLEMAKSKAMEDEDFVRAYKGDDYVEEESIIESQDSKALDWDSYEDNLPAAEEIDWDSYEDNLPVAEEAPSEDSECVDSIAAYPY